MTDYDKTVGAFSGNGFISKNTDNCNLIMTVISKGSISVYNLLSFRKPEIYVGREQGANDIVINSAIVSKQHFRLVMRFGVWYIENNPSSKNGLLCCGYTLSTKPLQDSDCIRIDSYINEAIDMSNASRDAEGVVIVFNSFSKNNSWKSYQLPSRAVTIGRAADCDIVLPHVSVSKCHCIIYTDNTGCYISDYNSTNGLSVNGYRVNGKRRLKNNDLIVIANAKLVFSCGYIHYYITNDGISLSAENIVRKVGKNNLVICDNCSLNIEPNDLVAIVGGSGAGKSTIMNCISGYNPPTSGRVYINGNDLYENAAVFKSIIGYVPQQDIVYDNLTVSDMLKYSAKLRLPDDSSEQDIKAAVQRVIDIVELTGKENTMIRSLSGGQKKRASIAVELISDPNLIFLDEPTSGLDPGTERNLIHTLKNMTKSGKTIILVTHSTLQLKMCDKIVFMGRGGRLCFCGNYDEACAFFKVDNIVDIYNKLNDESKFWQAEYNRLRFSANNAYSQRQNRQNAKLPQLKPDHGFFKQTFTLCARYIKLIVNDRQRLLLLLLQAPLLGLLLYLVSDGTQYEQFEMTQSIMFALSCSAFWIGMLNSIQEICKERVILRREYMSGLSTVSYILSKNIVLALLSLIQTALLLGVFVISVGMANEGIFGNTYFIELFVTTYLTMVSAGGMGLFVSAMFKNPDRAMTLAPILLMPQILFSGIIFELSGAIDWFSYAISCKWAMVAYGTSANINSLQRKIIVQHPELEAQLSGLFEDNELFKFVDSNILSAWFILVSLTIIFILCSLIALKNLKKDR